MYGIKNKTLTIRYKTLVRLNVSQTVFGKDIGFVVRTFRFNNGQSSSGDNQNQTISCQLHLEPADEIAAEQAADCNCYKEEECSRKYFRLN